MMNANTILFGCCAVILSCRPTAPAEQGAKANDVLPAWALGEFVRPASGNPVIAPVDSTVFDCPMSKKKIAWQSNDTFNPAAVVMDDQVYVLYRAEDKSGTGIGGRTSRIGLAASSDGINMKRDSVPVLYPGVDNQQAYEWPGGCEDPRVAVTEDGLYVMLYTQWNRKVPRLAVATSKDLRLWQKHGPAFQHAYNGKYRDMASKSASIVTKIAGGKQVIAQLNGAYLMYWGENHVYAATSPDLVNWKPLEDENGSLKILMSPRKGFFDSHLTECGPPAVITNNGIVLLYNGKNRSGADSDTSYTANAYCAGQALFDLNDPLKLKDRLDKPFLVPTEPFEKSGQYPAGTVFIEGLVYFQKKWFLYFGCADSRVGVAVFTPATGKVTP
jgi:beta-1,2-mannosidase